jgi:hypothetical protein
VCVFRHDYALEDAINIGSHACSLVRLKLLHACDQQHSSRVSTASHRCHHKLRRNTAGLMETDGKQKGSNNIGLILAVVRDELLLEQGGEGGGEN